MCGTSNGFIFFIVISFNVSRGNNTLVTDIHLCIYFAFPAFGWKYYAPSRAQIAHKSHEISGFIWRDTISCLGAHTTKFYESISGPLPWLVLLLQFSAFNYSEPEWCRTFSIYLHSGNFSPFHLIEKVFLLIIFARCLFAGRGRAQKFLTATTRSLCVGGFSCELTYEFC